MSAVSHLTPQNLEAEEAILGAMVMSRRALEIADDVGLTAAHFYRPSHQVVFDAIRSVSTASGQVDEITVIDHLRATNNLEDVGGPVAIVSLTERVPAVSNAKAYAVEVLNQSTLRGLVTAGEGIARLGYEHPDHPDALVHKAGELVAALGNDVAGEDAAVSAGDTFDRLYDEWERRFEQGVVAGTPTGFNRLDAMTGGLIPQTLIVLAARPAMGKSALAVNIARHLALETGDVVKVFSLEMSREQVVTRIVSDLASVDAKRLMVGKPLEGDFDKLHAAGQRIKTAKGLILVDETGGITPHQIRVRCRRLMRRLDRKGQRLGAVVIDYLQLMELGERAENQNVRVSMISSRLKAMAKELGVPVIALSQLSREVEKRGDKRPMLSDLRDSGAVEQDADTVWFLYRPDYYADATAPKSGGAEVIVAKNRNGSTGTVYLDWVPEFTRFEDPVLLPGRVT